MPQDSFRYMRQTLLLCTNGQHLIATILITFLFLYISFLLGVVFIALHIFKLASLD